MPPTLFDVTKKPPLGTPLNRFHPIARGLCFAAVCNEGAGAVLIDSVSGARSGPFGSTIGWKETGSDGSPVLAFPTAAVSTIEVTNRVNFILNSGLQYTVMARVLPTSFATHRRWVWSYGEVLDTAFCIGLGFDAAGAVAVLDAGDPTTSISSTLTLPVNAWATIGVSTKGPSNRTFFYNGRLNANATAASVGAMAAKQPHVLGAAYLNQSIETTTFYDGLLAWVYVWNRALTDLEMQSFMASPYQLYYPIGFVDDQPATVAATGVAFDAVSNSGYQAAQSTYSWSHTCTGSNRFLSVDVSMLSVPGTTVTGITYNGVALEFLGAQSTVSGAGRVECWGLANPASGSNTIAVTLSASVASSGEAVSYDNVNQVLPTEAFNSAQATNVGAGNAAVTITPASDKTWIHAAIASDDTAVTANQTSRNNVTGALGSGADEDTGPITPAAATGMSYATGALKTWAIAGYAIRPTTDASTIYQSYYLPMLPPDILVRYPY